MQQQSQSTETPASRSEPLTTTPARQRTNKDADKLVTPPTRTQATTPRAPAKRKRTSYYAESSPMRAFPVTTNEKRLSTSMMTMGNAKLSDHTEPKQSKEDKLDK